MTRKDTIIIAVFVNSALLIALFATAIKRDETPSSKEIFEMAPIITESQKIKQEPISSAHPEVSQTQIVKKVPIKEETYPTIDFAKELEAITKAATTVEKKEPIALDQEKKIIVQKGDVLEKIAKVHEVSVEEILSYNQLTSTTLQIGQVIKIPQKTASPDAKYYTVKQGDNPWTIAVKNQIKVDELLKLNDLNEEKARRLRPGDKLRIR